jgi:hypothetical protein
MEHAMTVAEKQAYDALRKEVFRPTKWSYLAWISFSVFFLWLLLKLSGVI